MKADSKDSQTKANNQGEGDRESARRFNDAAHRFVEPPAGQAEIVRAGDVTDRERAELETPEKIGKARAKAEDPEVTRIPSGPASRPKGEQEVSPQTTAGAGRSSGADVCSTHVGVRSTC